VPFTFGEQQLNIVPFAFENQQIRVVTGEDGEHLFVARDVATALGYLDPAKAVSTHCKHAKSLISLGWANHPPLINQQLTLDPQTKVIPESDLYRLTLKSNLKSAEQFQDWVVEEVLPSIRKTGSYESNHLTPAERLLASAQLLVDHERKIADLSYRQAETQAQVKALVNGEDYYTIVGYGNLIGEPIDTRRAQKLGKVATKICNENGWKVGKANHPIFGQINSYPRQAVAEAFDIEQ
jgi:prophage antirepressor-like protein